MSHFAEGYKIAWGDRSATISGKDHYEGTRMVVTVSFRHIVSASFHGESRSYCVGGALQLVGANSVLFYGECADDIARFARAVERCQ